MRRSAPRLKTTRRPLIDVLREHEDAVTPEQLFREAGFDPPDVDEFYRELASLHGRVDEHKPEGPEAELWPERAHVLLRLRRGA